MICCNCDKDLAACTCPDLKERFERILKSEHLIIGDVYQRRIREQIARNESEQSKSE
jgi:hypothetical protein